MNSTAFRDVQRRMYELYNAKKWQDALDLLADAANTLDDPAEAARVVFWRTCFLTLDGQHDAAIGALQDGLDRGYWWAESRLRGDPDLAPLQGDDRLNAIITICAERRQAAEASVRSTRLVAEPPDSVAPPYPLLLALHGYDSSSAEHLPHWEPLAAHGWLVAAVQSTQLSGMVGYHWTDEARAVADLRRHRRELSEQYTINSDRLLIGGFSNGGRAALMAALSGAIPATHVVSLAASLRDTTLATLQTEGLRDRAPRVLFIIGEQDERVLPRAEQQAASLKQYGVAVTLQAVPAIGHHVPADLVERVLAWLATDGDGRA